MDLSPLRYFQTAARTGSMSAAARALQVSQPSLTQAIQKLERRFDTQLFLRTSRGVSLTTTGRLLLNASEEMIGLLERTEREITGLEQDDTGEFTIGCHESLGGYFLPKFIRGFMAQKHDIRLGLFNGPSADVRERVIARSVDFGLVVNPEPHPDLVMTRLFEDGVEVFVHRDEPPCGSLEDARARIAQGPLIYPGRVQQAQDIIARFVADGYMTERTLVCGDLEMVKALLLEGLGVGLLPRRVAESRDGGVLRGLHPELPAYPDTIFLLYRGDMHRTRAAVRVKDALVAHAAELRVTDPEAGSLSL